MKDIKSQLAILDEIMQLCESATVKPLQKKSSVMAIIEPKEDESEQESSPVEAALAAESDPKDDEAEDLKDKLGDMDLEDLKALYAKLK